MGRTTEKRKKKKGRPKKFGKGMDPDVKECLKLSDRGSHYNQAELRSDQSSDSGENNDDCIVNVSATSKKLKLEPQCSDSVSSST